MLRKLHFFAFAFSGHLSGGKSVTASVYLGFPNRLITVPRIQRAKEAAGVPADAVLTSHAYMGHMTLAQAKGQQ